MWIVLLLLLSSVFIAHTAHHKFKTDGLIQTALMLIDTIKVTQENKDQEIPVGASIEINDAGKLEIIDDFDVEKVERELRFVAAITRDCKKNYRHGKSRPFRNHRFDTLTKNAVFRDFKEEQQTLLLRLCESWTNEQLVSCSGMADDRRTRGECILMALSCCTQEEFNEKPMDINGWSKESLWHLSRLLLLVADQSILQEELENLIHKAS